MDLNLSQLRTQVFFNYALLGMRNEVEDHPFWEKHLCFPYCSMLEECKFYSVVSLALSGASFCFRKVATISGIELDCSIGKKSLQSTSWFVFVTAQCFFKYQTKVSTNSYNKSMKTKKQCHISY